MRIGIDISQIAYKGTGVGRFVRGLTQAICTYNKSHEWVFLFSGMRLRLDHEIKELIREKNLKLVRLGFPPTLLSYMWNKVRILPVETFTGPLDWFITSDWTEPPTRSKKATVIHDLTVYRHPETVDSKILKTQQKRLELVAQESSLIFADSNATKEDIDKFLPKLNAQVHTIYPGVEVQDIPSERLDKLKKKLNLRKNFILSVGKLEPRKNLASLLEAFEKANLTNTELLIAGQYGWGAKIQPQKNVRMLGYVSEEELATLYQECQFFVFPSLWEGFGYPVVEAMKFGKPVAVSNTSSLGEIAQGVGLTFDPLNVADITQCLKILAKNKKTRDELKRKSLARAGDFTWKNYYETMEKLLTTTQ